MPGAPVQLFEPGEEGEQRPAWLGPRQAAEEGEGEAVGRQLFLSVVAAVPPLRRRLGRHLGPHDPQRHERTDDGDGRGHGAARGPGVVDLLLRLALRHPARLARGEVAQLHVADLVGQRRLQFFTRQRRQRPLGHQQAELAVRVRGHAEVDGAHGQYAQPHRAAVPRRAPDPGHPEQRPQRLGNRDLVSLGGRSRRGARLCRGTGRLETT